MVLHSKTMKWFAVVLLALCVSWGSVAISKRVGDIYTLSSAKAAYTIEFKERVENAASGYANESKFLVAQRSDGSNLRLNYNETGAYTMKAVNFIPERKSVVVSESIQGVSTTYLSSHGAAGLLSRNQDKSCLSHPELVDAVRKMHKVISTDKFLGHDVVKSVIDTASTTTERWESPDCDCEALYEIVKYKNQDGKIISSTERVATSFVIGEPAANLFAIPASYKEMTPSALMSETSLRLYGADLPLITKGRLESATDRQYYQSRNYANK
jgi:hypothetical protein